MILGSTAMGSTAGIDAARPDGPDCGAPGSVCAPKPDMAACQLAAHARLAAAGIAYSALRSCRATAGPADARACSLLVS